MKKILYIPLLVLSLFFSACGAQNYKDNVSCNDLITTVQSLTSKDFSVYDSEYSAYIVSDTSLFNESKIIYSTEVNDIDEIAVFHSENEEKAKQLYSYLFEYIKETQKTQRAFIESYAPLEAQKLDNATAERIGNYVVYYVCNTEDGKKISSAIKTELKK